MAIGWPGSPPRPVGCLCGGQLTCVEAMVDPAKGRATYRYECGSCGSARRVTVHVGADPSPTLAASIAAARLRSQAARAFAVPPAQLGPERSPEPPRVSGKVLGFRVWTLDGYKLRSVAARAYWTVGVNEARCQRGTVFGDPEPRHVAPVQHCECGLYAYHDPRFASVSPGVIAGAVLAWGQIEVHPVGFRAQYAEPVLLAYDPQQTYAEVKRAEAIAGELALPFVAVSELGAEAAKYGEPVAAELRPDRMIPPHPMASGGMIMLPSPFGPASPPPRPKPTWLSRAPLMLVAFCVGLEVALGAVTGEWWIEGPGAVWCAAMFLVCLRFYRRRYRST